MFNLNTIEGLTRLDKVIRGEIVVILDAFEVIVYERYQKRADTKLYIIYPIRRIEDDYDKNVESNDMVSKRFAGPLLK